MGLSRIHGDMEVSLTIAAALIFVALVWDMFITVFSGNGGGPLSRTWYRLVWRGLLVVHQHRSIHRVLSLAGPFMLLASFLLWYLMLALALFLALAAPPGAVVSSTTGAPADLMELAYFVSSTISSLGYGDQVPTGFPWTIASTASTLGGAVIVTVSLSYVMAVLAAAIERRKLAQGIFGLGRTAAEIIEQARLHDPEQTLKVYVLNLTSELDHQALKLLTYPILKYFHSPSADLSPGRAILRLSDAMFLLGTMPEKKRPPRGLLHIADSSIARYVELSRPEPPDDTRQGSQPEHLMETARALGATRGAQEEFDVALKKYLPRRDLLVQICREDGWYEK